MSNFLRLLLLATVSHLAVGCAACPTGQIQCGGACVTVATDPNHCGSCESACAAGQACAAGACVASCATGLSNCSGSCRDLMNDRANCATCGTACADGLICSGGMCVATCATGLSACSGICRDLMADWNNCGGCGKACSSGQVCSKGACAVSCQTGLVNCSGNCRDLSSDPTNCGACGKTCPTGNTCTAGACTLACQMGLTACGGTCRDLMSDPANCGACATKCGAGMVCSSGACAVSCPINQMNCSGTCRDTGVDAANCGACGKACPANQLCQQGTCGAVCAQSMIACNGACVTTATDVNNCGTCGVKCAGGVNSNAVCVNGSCNLLCGNHFADCDGVPVNGCEVDLTSDPKNCALCGQKCPSGANSLPDCTNAMCDLLCALNFGNCDNSLVNGCESNLKTDSVNCGACGTRCVAGANGVAACTAGVCSLTCNAGFGDCNKNVNDGCETNTNTDGANCGGCGMVCAGNCLAGVCHQGPACSNGSYVDCNPQGSTLVNGSAFVDSNVVQGWTQCAGFLNTAGNDVSNTAIDNCLNTNRLRLRVYDTNNTVVVDVYADVMNSYNAWPAGPTYLGNNSLTLVTCNNTYWPCGNGSPYYSSTNGTGGGGCGGYAAGAPTISNGNGGQLTVAIGENDGKEIWQGQCYGNTQWTGYKAALYK